MKKSIITSAIALIITGAAFAQPVSDRAVVPVAVTLNQILRLHVTNGRSEERRVGKECRSQSGTNHYKERNNATDFVVASSTDWNLVFGAEDATLLETDNNA